MRDFREGPYEMADGVHVSFLAGHCPVIAEGTLDGVPFHFKARGTTFRFECGTFSDKEEFVADQDWVDAVVAQNVFLGNVTDPEVIRSFAAGWIDADQAETAILGFAERVRALRLNERDSCSGPLLS